MRNDSSIEDTNGAILYSRVLQQVSYEEQYNSEDTKGATLYSRILHQLPDEER